MKNKLFNRHTIILTLSCLIANIVFARLIGLSGIPLFLDSVGTVLAAALGGFLPGITVGFLSNFITSLVANDPVTSCYSVLSMLIAAVAVIMSKRGLLKKPAGALVAAGIFALIGGALGSVLTWVLYGFSFGQGISAPYAEMLFAAGAGLPKFWAQFVADMIIDLTDKIVTMTVIFLILRFFPSKLTDKFPLGYVYDKQFSFKDTIIRLRKERIYRKHSLRTKITALIMAITLALSVIAVTLGINIYKSSLIEEYELTCRSAVELIRKRLNGDDIERFLSGGETENGYKETEDYFYSVRDSIPEIKYIYVYQIREDGCHVIFDLDTDDLQGGEIGEIIGFDNTFEKFIPDLLAGKEIEPLVSNDSYGWLLTVYEPVYNSDGKCTAYAAADIGMDSITTDIYIFAICLASLLFLSFIIITVFSIWYCEKRVIEPISVLVSYARGFDYKGEGETGSVSACDKSVRTGDELEEVFSSMCRTEKEIAGYVSEINEKKEEIALMQRNIIYSLANMVENRDMNTGEHIKRTSLYVRIIGEKLCSEGYNGGEVTPGYVDLLTSSAPLHDIGKIKIPDAILNKPGKLTHEEFGLMKTHTTAGYEILKSALIGIRDGGYIAMAADMAAYHHERWDGGGYPNGLSGKDIPLCARIMAVADVFDALTSKRSYKEAMSFETAVDIIKEESGTHFDPDVVEAFLSEADKIKSR